MTMKKRFFRLIFPILSFLIFLWQSFHPALLFASANSLSASPAPSSPEPGSYACIVADDVFFYSEKNERQGLFLLPQTYYVKLLEYGEEYSKIEYGLDEAPFKKLTGYAKTTQLTFVEYLPVRPYLSYTFDVQYTIENENPLDSAFLNQITANCVYYGDYEVGSKIYCYVLRGDEFGYIPKPAALSFEKNEEYADYLASLQQQETSSQASKEKTSSPAQVGILIALCLLVPVLAALILKPPRRPPYERDEY